MINFLFTLFLNILNKKTDISFEFNNKNRYYICNRLSTFQMMAIFDCDVSNAIFDDLHA